MTSVVLKSKRDKTLRRRHPWVFAGAIAHVEGHPAPGETVRVQSSENEPLGLAAYSPESQIALRVWSFDPAETIDPAWLKARLARAIEGRGELATRPGAACRLVNAEADGLPGLIVDRYGDFAVCQLLSAGTEFWRDTWPDLLMELLPLAGVFERSDVDVRAKEGLDPRVGPMRGVEPPEYIEIVEGDWRFLVDVRRGHKTGFYLDQRTSRAVLPAFVRGEVLNCFSYTGAFGVVALGAGAEQVTDVDSSADALAMCHRHVALNGLPTERLTCIDGDVFHVLRHFRDSRRSFDTIILDPPKFADSKDRVERACRGYKDINLLAFKLLRPGGILVTFSCSGLVNRELFERTVAFAAADAGRDIQVLRTLEQAPDHPGSLQFTEASYLKGLVCRAL